jgi:oxygen-independent coproporphyrinogen III oxidase
VHWNLTSPADSRRHDPAAVFAAGMEQHAIANTAYPIGHLTTMRPYRITRRDVQSFAPQPWEGIDRLGLYVHIPFCEARCGFCEYAVIDPKQNAIEKDDYFDLLLQEFELWDRAIDSRRKTLTGFDIGGGTPSLPDARQIGRVMEAAARHFHLPADVVVSIETTPKIAASDPGKLVAYRAMGIQRISMGVQTVNACLLEAIGRTATTLEWNRQAVENIRAAGYDNFNVDVMYGFARQNVDSVEATLRHTIDLAPEHITLYQMRYKGTRIAHQAGGITWAQIGEQAQLVKQMLAEAGYWAVPGKNTFSRIPGDLGTSDYLTNRVVYGTPYLGIGLGAQTLSHTALSYNTGAADKDMRLYRRYVEAGKLPIQDIYHMSREAAMGKFIAVAFYFGGIHLPSFHEKFDCALEAALPDAVDFVLSKGLMEYSGETLQLTAASVEAKPGVHALFYAPAVQEHLLKLCRGERVRPRSGWRREWQAEWEELGRQTADSKPLIAAATVA